MKIKITKLAFHYLLLLFLVTAFLAMQWAPAHIHLSERHNHDDTHHQHQINTHAHSLANQAIFAAEPTTQTATNSTHHQNLIDHANTFSNQFADSAAPHQSSHKNIIVLVHKWSLTQQEKQPNPFTLVNKAISQVQPPSQVKIKRPIIHHTKQNHLDTSTVHSRAPPQLS